MIPAERQHFILSCLVERDVISIAELTERLGVSHMTVRRDIQTLERQSRVTSVSGGVRLSQRLQVELPHLAKTAINADQKGAIGRAAARMVQDGMVVYLDAGTTTLEIARAICDRDALTVVTNDFVISAYLSQHSRATLYHSGGLVDGNNRSCVGEIATGTLGRFNYDIAFISTSSWTIAGLSSPTEAKRPVKSAVLERTRRAVLVSDSAKYGVVAAINILPMDVFDAVVTDGQIDAGVAGELRDMGLEVILAEMPEADDPSAGKGVEE
ncbi:DeoR/GlpR family DNA-binding transcription regulator [Falsirhodobacter algicola]|uniref:DeoR family transcriptional regulator n=1 Tax=Falsirhodobacter algicola TaxID=2692330 RepID=A0A8J8MVG6_9RHOB|nr:DeoR/GlpR family DNA-binding transcription regulator [Falsirhodobacter algicola]QUS37189.1 DeoR family transcriptional regulator [Falsirhodobacter algicola]